MTFCQSKGGIPYFETSAKEAINVEQAFEGMIYPPLSLWQLRNRHILPRNHKYTVAQSLTSSAVIARNALAQEESEEFSGDFGDPINIHMENDRDGCAC
jgi:Ras-related protein Rab-7A